MSFFRRATAQNSTPPEPATELPLPPAPDVSAVPVPIAPEEEAAPSPTRIFESALGAGSTLEGSLSSDGNVRLDGKFKGTLNIKENVLIGATAEIEADVNAKNVSIAGTVRGNVSGGKVHLLSTAKVWGDISAQALITEDGAFIDGRVQMRNTSPVQKVPSAPESTEE